jgi:hypothetical protein
MTRSHSQGRQQPWSAEVTRHQLATDAATAFVVTAAMPAADSLKRRWRRSLEAAYLAKKPI